MQSQQQQPSLQELMQQVLNHPDLATVATDPVVISHMNAAGAAASKLLMNSTAETDIIDSRGQKVMMDAGVGTIAHPEFENRVPGTAGAASSTSAAGELSDIAKQAAASVEAQAKKEREAEAAKVAARPKQPDLLEGLWQLAKKQLFKDNKTTK
jgi:hypothetical protein